MNDMHTIGVVLQFLCIFYLGDGMNTNDDDDYDNLFYNYINYDELAIQDNCQFSFLGNQSLANANIESNQLATKSINEPSLPTSNSNISKEKNVVISNKNENNGISANNNRTGTKRKREKKSKRKQQLTQVVHADVANFRQVVQHLTSAPEWRRPIHNDAASIGGLLNMHDGRLNHSSTAPNQQNNGQLNHSSTAPNQQNNGQLNHSVTAPNQSTAAHYKSPSQALDGAAFQYEGHSFPILESSRPFDDVSKQ
uniref:VQ domain-containing protein n=1 Tax=Globodera rostochiensis TaxID=31243 RepID=A0A914I6W3_GLORO